MIEKDILCERLHLISEQIPQSEWTYYHIESIQNFIFHLNSIKSERTKARTAEAINEYISFIEQKAKQEQDPEQLYKELHRNYIWQLSHVYTDEVGFILRPDYPLFILILLILFCILQFFIPISYAFAIIAILLAIWVSY
jgi:hypothetical protein